MTREQEREIVLKFIEGRINSASKSYSKARTQRDANKYGGIAHEMQLLKHSIEALYNIKPIES